MATRRSPRTIENFCKGLSLEGLASERIGVLLSLTRLSGWSADRIALKIFDLYSVKLTAEQVYNFHSRWVLHRGGNDDLDWSEQEIAEYLLVDAGISLVPLGSSEKLEYLGRSLRMTVLPITVKFLDKWSPAQQAIDGEGPCHGFDLSARTQSKAFLRTIMKKSAWGKFTPTEEAIISQFGPLMAALMRDIIRRFNRAMQAKIQEGNTLRPLNVTDYVNLILVHLNKFKPQYEHFFGYVEVIPGSELGDIKNDVVGIRSTAKGAKVLLGLMMADRLHVVKTRREEERLRVLFQEIDYQTLAADRQACIICYEQMGVKNAEGVMETCVEMVICCGQCIGGTCLKTWLTDENTCPHCRHELPLEFMNKLFGEDEEFWEQIPIQPSRAPRVAIPSPDADWDASLSRQPDSSQDESQFEVSNEAANHFSIEIAIGHGPVPFERNSGDDDGDFVMLD